MVCVLSSFCVYVVTIPYSLPTCLVLVVVKCVFAY